MPGAVRQLDEMLKIVNDEAVADRFAEIVEQWIDFTSRETYFHTLTSLAQPIGELYATLIFNTDVRMDGLADTINKYDDAAFLTCLRDGLRLLGETKLLAVIDRAVAYMADPNANAHSSRAPNVTMDVDTGDIHHDYFQSNVMQSIGRFLRANAARVGGAAREMDGRAATGAGGVGGDG